MKTSVMVLLMTMMVQVGEARAARLGHTSGISWVEGDAQALPFPDNSFDVYTVAFGIRNVVRVEEALAEAYRVLRPGGRWDLVGGRNTQLLRAVEIEHMMDTAV